MSKAFIPVDLEGEPMSPAGAPPSVDYQASEERRSWADQSESSGEEAEAAVPIRAVAAEKGGPRGPRGPD